MKTVILLIMVFASFQLLAIPSDIKVGDESNFIIENMDPFGAKDLNELSEYQQTFDARRRSTSTSEIGSPGKKNRVRYVASNPCPFEFVALYYQLRASTTDSNLVIGEINTGDINHQFEVFGPFISLEEGARQIQTNTARSIYTSGLDSTQTLQFNSREDGVYVVRLTIKRCNGQISISILPGTTKRRPPIPCEDCIPGFNPGAGKYIFSAWVKEENALPTKTKYTFPSIEVEFPLLSLSYEFTPSGQIIDGWQKIDTIFEVPNGASEIVLKLKVSSGNAFFDDIRIFPYDGSMISYVYDPITLRLVAELDERNYAKIYEYDEEGKLIRVKKETEKGIMTIQENRENSVKKL